MQPHSEFAALRDRLDRLSRRLEQYSEQQSDRIAALELRESQLEVRQSSVDQSAALIDELRAEIAALKAEISRLDAEAELDRKYRDRVARLERVIGDGEPPAESGETIDDIWASYVREREEIQALGEQLAAPVEVAQDPKP